MKYEESIANINQNGKQSICLCLKSDVQKFLELLQDHDLIADTSDYDTLSQLIADCIMVIDGQCCEGDYMITTDENVEHDFEAFEKTILEHEWEGVTESQLMTVWEKLKPFVTKHIVTWG